MSNQFESGKASTMPVWAMVLSILLPPVGVVIGHVALRYMQTGEISSVNKGLATAAVTVGWILTGIIVGFALLILLLIVGLQSFFGSLTYS